ncbi:hypothetical protein F750_0188 [Streptomyces sp. PAMC 26508]|nr:hypothetical protein F750_0188 [Streptomyces sp. PAMC 26508]
MPIREQVEPSDDGATLAQNVRHSRRRGDQRQIMLRLRCARTTRLP